MPAGLPVHGGLLPGLPVRGPRVPTGASVGQALAARPGGRR
jgi:hypothetical protein